MRQLLYRILKSAAVVATVLLVMLGASMLAMIVSSGVLFWLILGILSIGLIWLLQHAIVLIARKTGKNWNPLRLAQNTTLVIISSVIVIGAVEGLLAVLEKRAPPVQAEKQGPSTRPSATPADVGTEAALVRRLAEFGVRIPVDDLVKKTLWRHSLLTMPPEWERTRTETNGEIRSYRWHGIVQVFDRNSQRRTTPFPPKLEDRFRVMVVGDSLTYGTGIDETQTYAAMAQRILGEHYRVEFLNLGVGGYQSEDVLEAIRRFLPELHPDLVIYGVCHNDFLPTGVGQQTANHAYAFPLRESIKQALMRHSRVIKLTSDAYHNALLRLGLRADFYDQILGNFRDYQGRFARDVKSMNDEVVGQGLPPMVAIVLDQFPALDSRGHRITEVAEGALRSAGIHVIPTANYYRHFAGENFSVSKWEGHPNEIANVIWATMIAADLEGRPELAPFSYSTKGAATSP